MNTIIKTQVSVENIVAYTLKVDYTAVLLIHHIYLVSTAKEKMRSLDQVKAQPWSYKGPL